MCDHETAPAATLDAAMASQPYRSARRGFLRGAGIVGLGLAGVGLVGVERAYAVTSQNGWPAAPDLGSDLDRHFAVAGTTFPAGVRVGDVSTVLGHVAGRFNAEVEAFGEGCWGFAYREISGSSTVSNHGSGTAIDINAPRHPLGQAGTFSAAQVTAIHAIVAECEGVVRWGGDYSGRKDEMHFEINVGPGSADLSRVAAKFGGGGGTAHPTIKKGSTGAAVSEAQTLLNAKGYGLVVDGDFGTATENAVKDFQTRSGLTADGIVGPQTWAALES